MAELALLVALAGLLLSAWARWRPRREPMAHRPRSFTPIEVNQMANVPANPRPFPARAPERRSPPPAPTVERAPPRRPWEEPRTNEYGELED